MNNKIACRVTGLIFSLLVSCLIVAGQAKGTISGRIISEDGNGVADATVSLWEAGGAVRGAVSNTSTDEDGNFSFTNLSPRPYAINVFSRGYIQAPIYSPERRAASYYHIGDNVTITLIKGGVITGRVTDADGEPVIGIQVSAIRRRDAEGYPLRYLPAGQPRYTDDRGIYRLFGLLPGVYIIVANGRSFSSGMPSPYDGETPTYYPSSTIDTAGEVNVTSGGEVTGADIRFSGERGFVISGKMIGGESSTAPYGSGASVALYSVATGAIVANSFVRPGENNEGYAIYGVADGEYEVTASRAGSESGDWFNSQPRRVSVRGADVSGVDLSLVPLSSISGKAVVEASSNVCEDKSNIGRDEIVLFAVNADKAKDSPSMQSRFTSSQSIANDKGEFNLRNLNPGFYRIRAVLPNEIRYVKSISINSTASQPTRRGAAGLRSAGAIDVSRSAVNLKSGEKLTGVTVTIAEGGASLRGKLIPANEGSRLSSRLRLHLVPAETTAIDDLLRYSEVTIRGDGNFSFNNIHPGKYWLIARPVPDDELIDREVLPAAWDSGERLKLRKEAEAKKIEIELKPCQRVSEQILKY
jgi:protocatechuate 3,4-dioxygenase beta subunit